MVYVKVHACVCVTAQGKPRFGFQVKKFKHNWKRQTLGVQKPMTMHFLGELLMFLWHIQVFNL